MQPKTLTTTILTVDPDMIDWATVHQQGVFVEYEIPYSERRKWDYLHNWYLRQSIYPYYLHSTARTLYVLYPDNQAVQPLTYADQTWSWQPMPIQHADRQHALIKLLMSAFFTRRRVLVSNKDFYLLVSQSRGGYARVLNVELRQEWRDGRSYEFVVDDRATTLHRVSEVDTQKRFSLYGAHYAVDYREGLPVLRRLHPDHITRDQIVRGIYYEPQSRTYRTQMALLDVRNEDTLRRCRSYYLHWFLTDLVAYFNEIGLPFHLKELPFQKVSQGSETFKKPQLSLQGSTVALIDDRLRPYVLPEAEPPEFATLLIQRVQDIVTEADWTPTLNVVEKTDLQPDDLVLRLQDNLGDAFATSDDHPEGAASGLLAAYDDPYKLFQQTHGDTISQSLNVNSHAQTDIMVADEIEADDGDGDTPDMVSEDTLAPTTAAYLSYTLPTTAWLRLRVLNSLNQLCLKLMVRSPAYAGERFPILNRLNDTIFLYQNTLVYRDGHALVFQKTLGNDEARQVIRERTGWDIIEDILLPAQQRNDYTRAEQPDPDKMNNLLKQGRFMVSSRAVWQIEDCTERVLYNIPEIQRRMRARTTEHPKHAFYPAYTPEELRIFDQQTLDAFAAFLTTTVREQSLSFNHLVQHYKAQGLYEVLGIQQVTKLQKYAQLKKIWLGSVKSVDVLPAYTGISYLPDTQQYYVGDKYGLDASYQQERGFVLRRIVVHKEREGQIPLDVQVRTHLFPLLEVNFVRYLQYTVYPFPFKLIEIWNSHTG